MGELSRWMYGRSSGLVTLLGALIFLGFGATVLPAQARAAAVYSETAGSPDQGFLYDAAELYAIAEAYGAAGRAAYIRARWTFDVIFPLVYLFFLATSISWLLAKAFPPGRPWRRLNLVPVLGAFFDLLENSGATIVFARYPAQTPLIDSLTPLFSLVKWLFVGGSFVVLLFAGLVAAVRLVAERRTAVN